MNGLELEAKKPVKTSGPIWELEESSQTLVLVIL
jgi:hypothetical protein